MIGRSLYVLPLEWWYLQFDPQNIMFVCTEELSDPSTLNELVLQLGLPSYNFTSVVEEGAYNVGGHRGYDKATSWEELEKDQEDQEEETMDVMSNATMTNTTQKQFHHSNDAATPSPVMTNGIPISQELYDELQEFVKPFNERLFALTGKRCNW
jgi:hypothetical protein